MALVGFTHGLWSAVWSPRYLGHAQQLGGGLALLCMAPQLDNLGILCCISTSQIHIIKLNPLKKSFTPPLSQTTSCTPWGCATNVLSKGPAVEPVRLCQLLQSWLFQHGTCHCSPLLLCTFSHALDSHVPRATWLSRARWECCSFPFGLLFYKPAPSRTAVFSFCSSSFTLCRSSSISDKGLAGNEPY